LTSTGLLMEGLMRHRLGTSRISYRNSNKPNSAAQRGYALLMILFFLALLVMTVSLAAPDILTRGRREREEEMVWRGKQYERGIKLFYAKNHRIPSSIDELTGTKQGIRFMRKAYKDPMNEVDGSWRIISIGPTGQLIGSTRPNAAFRLGVPGGGNPNVQGISGLRANGSDAGFQGNLGAPQTADRFATAGAFQNSSQTDSSPQIFGGNIIGVGSKIDKNSILWLDGAKSYLQFEFIWDPSKEGMGVNPLKLIGSPAANSNQPPAVTGIGQTNEVPAGPLTSPTPQ
jgi:hypothetical protein